MDGLLKELARSLVDDDSATTRESAEEILAQAHADELADTELILDAQDMMLENAATDEDAVDDTATTPEPAIAIVPPPSRPDQVVVPKPAITEPTTVSLFDYMAAHPAARRKGKKTRQAQPSAQLLLFELFEERPAVVEPMSIAPDAELQQAGLFATAS